VAEEDSVVAVKAGTIVPVTTEPIQNGVILIRHGKIDAVGRGVEIPDGAKVIDVSDKVVIPGLIDASTTLAEQRDDEESVTPDIRAKDGFDLYGNYRRMLAGGVTTVYVSPGQNRLVGGMGAVVKLAGQPTAERYLDDQAALRVSVGELPKNPPGIFDPPLPPDPDHPILPEEKQLPTTRMAEWAVLNRVFTQARLDQQQKGPDPIDPKTGVLIRALGRKLPVRVHCHNVQDIRRAISFAKAFKLDLVIDGATEAYRAVDQIKDGKIPVVVTGVVRPGRVDPRDYARDVALGRINPANPAILAEAGVRFAISAPTDDCVADLLSVAGHSVNRGISTELALQAITIRAAEILCVADRVGSIEQGKDADLVVLTHQPFSIQSVVDRTIVNGETVYARKSDDQQTPEQPTLAVRAGKIFTASEGQLAGGLILIKDSKITYVGPPKEIPDGTTVIDAGKRVVIPGMIDIHSHLGLHWESEPARLDGSPATAGPNSDRLKLASIAGAIAPNDEAFQDVMRRGVTSVLLAPATTGLVSGNAALIKTAGGSMEDVVVKEYAAVKFSMLGSGGRMARIWQARELLKKAKEYAEKWEKYDREHQVYQHRRATAEEGEIKEPARPGRDVKLELLRGLFQRKMPAVVHASRADAIVTALQVFDEEYNLDVLILGGHDSYRIVPELKKHRARVAIGPEILQYDKGKAINNADILVRNGLRVAFHTSATSGTQYLPEGAGYAVRHGMDRNKALRAITSYPAEMLYVDGQIGSIDVGKDADLVILSGEPFEFTSRVEKVIVNGKIVFDSDK
jgi:imidazolonepropionase-like amidohydrolase